MEKKISIQVPTDFWLHFENAASGALRTEEMTPEEITAREEAAKARIFTLMAAFSAEYSNIKFEESLRLEASTRKEQFSGLVNGLIQQAEAAVVITIEDVQP